MSPPSPRRRERKKRAGRIKDLQPEVSNRAIAKTLGVDEKTVRNDAAEVAHSFFWIRPFSTRVPPQRLQKLRLLSFCSRLKPSPVSFIRRVTSGMSHVRS